jgi:aminoglycoside 6'-N-acetyltransferase
MGARDVITWRRVRSEDFALLAQWLAQPHVHRYWHHDFSPAGVERDFGPGTRGQEKGEDLLVFVDDHATALVQRSRIADYAEDFEELSAIVDVPDGAVTIDYLIGDPARDSPLHCISRIDRI